MMHYRIIFVGMFFYYDHVRFSYRDDVGLSLPDTRWDYIHVIYTTGRCRRVVFFISLPWGWRKRTRAIYLYNIICGQIIKLLHLRKYASMLGHVNIFIIIYYVYFMTRMFSQKKKIVYLLTLESGFLGF